MPFTAIFLRSHNPTEVSKKERSQKITRNPRNEQEGLFRYFSCRERKNIGQLLASVFTRTKRIKPENFFIQKGKKQQQEYWRMKRISSL